MSVQPDTSHTFISIDYTNVNDTYASDTYASDTYASDIDGSNIVGFYSDSNWDSHGFLATSTAVVVLPTGASMGLGLLGAIGGFGFVRRRIRAH